MEQTLIAGALFLATFLSPATPPTQSSELPQIEQVITYRVEKGDTILSIAKSHYRSQEYWTTLWNDNEDIENPDLIENGSLLKIRSEKQNKPEELKNELAKKYKKDILASAKVIEKEAEEKPQSEVKKETTPAPVATYAGGPLNQDQLNFLGSCESGMNPATNTGNGFYGAFQFTVGTWNSMGTGYARADLAPLDVQVDATQRLLGRSSIYSQFPGCAARMRAAGLL